uniref:F-box domain-containing protein n=1 Tax=Astatotilapia calliptera TaxID=8154 RepID=A0AAX7VA34_ASTCA
MAQNPSKLPPEVWNNVFGYLSATEKLNVRATCKYFKTIVDHRSLWKNWTVVLDFKNGSYNRKFWDTLRHRKVSSAVMKSTKVKHWKQLALFLPILTTVVMDQSSQECFSCLKDFPNMRRLVLRSSCSDLLLDISRFPLFLPEKLTYLSMWASLEKLCGCCTPHSRACLN